MVKFLSTKKYVKEQNEYGNYVLECIRECKEAIPFEEYNKIGAS